MAPVLESHQSLQIGVSRNLFDRRDRLLQLQDRGSVAGDQLQDELRGAHFQGCRVLAHVRIAQNEMEAAILLPVCMGFVSRVEDRAGCASYRRLTPFP